MYKRYFRMKDPKCRTEQIEWVEMTGREFYRFVNSLEGKGRYFIDMDDVVLETSEVEARNYKTEQNHSYYIQIQEEGRSILSLYAVEDKNGCSGEEVIMDETQDVEDEAIMRIEHNALLFAFSHLDAESRQLIHALYLADMRKTERELAQERGVSQVAIHKQKKKILARLKSLVIKFQKSQQ